MKPDSEEMTRQLARLRADYLEVEKKPLKRFYCPIIGQDDENADLCLGHVIHQKIPNSSRKTIVQRKDVDGFYGRLLEPAWLPAEVPGAVEAELLRSRLTTTQTARCA